jgi:hypothetical protein
MLACYPIEKTWRLVTGVRYREQGVEGLENTTKALLDPFAE